MILIFKMIESQLKYLFLRHHRKHFKNEHLHKHLLYLYAFLIILN